MGLIKGSSSAALPKAPKPRAHLDASARTALTAFLRARENEVMTIDELTLAWNETQVLAPLNQLSSDRVAEIMQHENIRGPDWKQSDAGKRTFRAIRRNVAKNQRQDRDTGLETRRAAQRALFQQIESEPEQRDGLRVIDCPACKQPCFNTAEFFPSNGKSKKLNFRRCIICRDIRRTAFERKKVDGGDKLALAVEKKEDARRAADLEATNRRGRLDSLGDRSLKVSSTSPKRFCVGCQKTRPLRYPYFLRVGGGEKKVFSTLCSLCESDFDRLLSRAQADKLPAKAASVKLRRKNLLKKARVRERTERREAAVAKAASWTGTRATCPTCSTSFPLTKDYYFVSTLVRGARRGEISRTRQNCRFCEGVKDQKRKK